MLQKALLVSASVLVLCGVVGCNTPEDPTEAAVRHEAAARQVARIESEYGTMGEIVEVAKHAALLEMRPIMEGHVGRELTRTENEQLQGAIEQAFAKTYPSELWEEAMATIYLKYFTTEELNDIIEYYRSQTGSKALSLQRAITKEAEKAGEAIAVSREERFEDAFADEYMEALFQ